MIELWHSLAETQAVIEFKLSLISPETTAPPDGKALTRSKRAGNARS